MAFPPYSTTLGEYFPFAAAGKERGPLIFGREIQRGVG